MVSSSSGSQLVGHELLEVGLFLRHGSLSQRDYGLLVRLPILTGLAQRACGLNPFEVVDVVFPWSPR